MQTLSGVYAITDDELLAGPRLLSATEQALAAGVKLLQWRSKSTDSAWRLAQATALRELTSAYAAALIINDDVDLALAVKADGVHLGQSDGDLTAARERLGQEAIIGRTCHADLTLALQAQQQGASYVAFGRFFASHTKPNAPGAPIELLQTARRELSLPIVAIGGINPENGGSLVQAGADMLAVIHSLFGQDKVSENAKALRALFAEPK